VTSDRFELHGARTIDELTEVRRFIDKIYCRLDGDLRARVAMVMHELFENAIKFSTDGISSLVVDVVHSHPIRVEVRTTNRASAKNRDAIRERVDAMRAAGNAMQHYVALMRSSRTSGGLGLGRIAAEGEMQLDVAIDGEAVTICAMLQEAR